jgi:hypothetical protein
MLAHARRETPDTDLTRECIVSLLQETEGVCGIAEVEMNMTRDEGQNSAYTPSLDRKDVNKGYVKGNVWVVSLAANRMKGTRSVEEAREFIRLVVGIVLGGKVRK